MPRLCVLGAEESGGSDTDAPCPSATEDVHHYGTIISSVVPQASLSDITY